ncbi:unnamed protein product [Symbiodinium sp. CCMP2456]|nr:unnamed protein product [Symbiodinium sp. CCMP2456]
MSRGCVPCTITCQLGFQGASSGGICIFTALAVSGGRGVTSSDGDTVIHVIDDVRQIRRDFMCKHTLLLEHMRYFESCLAGVSAEDEVEISVHCDIKVFEWLAEYMEGTRQVSSLEPKDIVSILISSDFLQMHKLVEECLQAMHDAIADILPLPLDLGCVPDRLVGALASHFRPEELAELQDPRDRLRSRLWAHLLHGLLSQGDSVINCCARCQRIFTARERLSNACPKTAGCGVQAGCEQLPFVLQHTADVDWDVGRFLYHLWIQLGRSWADLYWKVWARLQHFHCATCKSQFCGLELADCRYHPHEPVLNEGMLVYPCCKAVAAAAPHGLRQPGCCIKEHIPDLSGATDQAVLEQLRRRMPTISAGAKDALLVVESAQAQDLIGQGEEVEPEHATGAAQERTPRAPPAADGKEAPEAEAATPKHVDAANSELCPKARYCCDPPPEHNPSGHGSAARSSSRPRRRPRSAAAHRGEESPKRAMEYRLQRSPYDDSNSLDDFFVDASDSFADLRLPTFFEPKLPKGVANQRKLHHMMDVLREDDRRRMDELVARSCVYQSKVVFERQRAAKGPSAVERQVQKLAWLVSGWTSDGPQHPDSLVKTESRPRRARPTSIR